MILQKVINNVNIKSEYKEFVMAFKTCIINEFGEKIHSIYMCGSIPKGIAKPYESDADFTILCDNPRDINSEKLSRLKEQLLADFPLVTKIDTTICSLDNVRNNPNDWGFWVKIICVCIYGLDIGEEVPPIVISRDFILDLNSDTKQAVDRVNDALSNAIDNKMKCRYIKGYSKRLIRALYSLVLEEVGVWQDNIAEMKNSIIRYSDIDPALVEYLYECYLNSDLPINEFKVKATDAYTYFEHRLSTMQAHRTSFS